MRRHDDSNATPTATIAKPTRSSRSGLPVLRPCHQDPADQPRAARVSGIPTSRGVPCAPGQGERKIGLRAEEGAREDAAQHHHRRQTARKPQGAGRKQPAQRRKADADGGRDQQHAPPVGHLCRRPARDRDRSRAGCRARCRRRTARPPAGARASREARGTSRAAPANRDRCDAARTPTASSRRRRPHPARAGPDERRHDPRSRQGAEHLGMHESGKRERRRRTPPRSSRRRRVLAGRGRRGTRRCRAPRMPRRDPRRTS